MAQPIETQQEIVARLLGKVLIPEKPKEEPKPKFIAHAKTLEEISYALSHPEEFGLVVKPGRTLAKGFQYTGADLPNRGSAAKRRIKQMEKLNARHNRENANS